MDGRIHARLHRRRTWVGNFDGSPMRGVSGVTGAGPLWNRIMLHLYERNDDPLPFSAPRGFVRAHDLRDDRARAVAARALPGDRDGVGTAARARGRGASGTETPATAHPLSARWRRLRAQCRRRRRSPAANSNSRCAPSMPAHRCAGAWTAHRSRSMRTATRFGRCGSARGASSAQDGKQNATVTIRVVAPPQHARPGFTRRGG